MYLPVTGPWLDADAASQIDEHLSKNEWFAGGEGPTVADYMMIFPLELLRQSGSSTPNIDAYIDRAQTRPAYRRVSSHLTWVYTVTNLVQAIARGGPYLYDYQKGAR